MEWHGEVVVDDKGVVARCFLPGCAYNVAITHESLRWAVRDARTYLCDHRRLMHEEFKGPARVDLRFADGVTV